MPIHKKTSLQQKARTQAALARNKGKFKPPDNPDSLFDAEDINAHQAFDGTSKQALDGLSRAYIPVLAAGTYWLAWQVDTSANVPSYVAGGVEGDGFLIPMSFGPFPQVLVPGFGSPTAWTTTDECWSVSINYEVYNQTERRSLFK